MLCDSRIHLYTDASYDLGTRRGFAGLAAVSDRGERFEDGKDIGPMPGSTQAEYAALVWGLDSLLNRGLGRYQVRVCLDHQVLWQQLMGFALPPKHRDLCLMLGDIRKRLARFQGYDCMRVERVHNLADRPGREAMRRQLSQPEEFRSARIEPIPVHAAKERR